eukprot:Hpha_TRINITY_DN12950_c0_g1::TRINITY_DN12950_c0_g1_i1::g.164798::m.164798/K13348/MPV17; protein Mpv17
MSQVNQYEDFQSVEHVLYVLGEFVVVNAAFSFATDMCTQKLEGKWFFCAPAPPPVDPPEGEADEGKEGGEGPGKGVAAVAPRWDVSRSCRFAVTGVFFCGVVQFIRLSVIDVMFDRGDKSLKAAVWKTVLNQAVFSPIVRAWSMMTVRYMYERSRGKTTSESWSGACTNLRDKFCEAQGISYMVKPVSNFLAFAIFPNHILGQAIMMRTVAFVYNVYFDYVVHVEQAQEEDDESPESPESPEDAKKAEPAEEKLSEDKPQAGRTSANCCGCSIM